MKIDNFFAELKRAMAERDSAAMARAVAAIPPQGLQGERDNAFWPREWYAGLAARSLGDIEAAQAAFAAARPYPKWPAPYFSPSIPTDSNPFCS